MYLHAFTISPYSEEQSSPYFYSTSSSPGRCPGFMKLLKFTKLPRYAICSFTENVFLLAYTSSTYFEKLPSQFPPACENHHQKASITTNEEILLLIKTQFGFISGFTQVNNVIYCFLLRWQVVFSHNSLVSIFLPSLSLLFPTSLRGAAYIAVGLRQIIGSEILFNLVTSHWVTYLDWVPAW